MDNTNEVRRQTIDGLYQSILAAKCQFPEEIREVFHTAMNSLSKPLLEEPSQGVLWSEALDFTFDFLPPAVIIMTLDTLKKSYTITRK